MDEYSIALGEYNRPKALPRPKRLPRPKGLPSNPASAVCTLGAYPDRRGLSSARALPCDVDLGRQLRTKNSIALGGFSPWVKCRSPEGTASPEVVASPGGTVSQIPLALRKSWSRKEQAHLHHWTTVSTNAVPRQDNAPP